MINSNVFKVNKTFIIICLLLVGTCSSVFAIDFSQALSQAQEQSQGIDKLFEGKAQVSNLYKKALKLSKDREINATTTSLDHLKEYYSNCGKVKNEDFINVLYNSNSSFKTTFDDDQLLPAGTKKPTTDEITKSYDNFFACKGIGKTHTAADKQAVDNEVQNIYYEGYSNAFSISTLNQDNFGSDLLRNGATDDGDFDLLYDINQIGKILFESFNDSPQVLFYRLPEVGGALTQGGGDLSSLSDQSSYQVGGGTSSSGTPGSLVGITTLGGSPTPGNAPSLGITALSQSQTASADKNAPSLSDDKDIQAFIENTNPTASTTPGVALLLGNQCLTGDTSAPVAEEQPELETPEKYISDIVNFINNANINDVINDNLLTVFKRDNPLPPGGSTSDPGYAETLANTYAEKAFGEAAPGTCEYGCKDLSLDEQAQCELKCSKSCIQKCSGLGIQDKLLCVSDCTCFLIAGPNGAGWSGVEDMFRIKFCKVPVEKTAVKPGKKVFSIQAIFQEISDVLEGLRDSGQTTKFSKKKEFLDSNIKINFADTFAFKLQVNFKPLFPKKSAATKEKEQQQDMRDFSLGIMNMNVGSPTADDPNKYIVISDPIRNDATMEEAASLGDITQTIADFTAASQAAKAAEIPSSVLTDLRKAYVNKTPIAFVQNMISFLEDNQTFRQNTSEALSDMTKMSNVLKLKIDSSK